jgi:NADH-quinone oxidoreductase subunit K
MDLMLSHYTYVATALFLIGSIGIFLNYRNIILLLMSIELILLAANLNFVAFSHALDEPSGQVFALFVLAVAAAEAAIGLSILVIYFRNKNTLDVDAAHLMKG